MIKVWERSFRRANLSLAYSQGFHPQPKIVEADDEARALLTEARQASEAEYSAAEDRGDPVGTTEWNLARIKCTACDTDKGVQYLSLTRDESEKATESPTRAEVCDECKSYLKIFYQDKDPRVEPNADDLATLALDILVDEQGYGRSGPNLLFHPGTA